MKWIYESCSDCDPIVSTSQLHSDGDQAIWYNCCWYAVPEEPVVTADPDTELEGPVETSELDCETWSSGINSVEFQRCDDETIKMYWDCSCAYAGDYYIGLTVNGFTGLDANGDPIVSDMCWTITALSSEPLGEIECDGVFVQNCEEDPCPGPF